MAKTLQHRRGTTTELASVTGAVGEIFMDTTKNTLVVFDGQSPSTPHALATEAFVLANSGGSSSYNQSLNTTNDVVFNSALIGDVSLVGNTIAGLDSYGNSATLTVDSNLHVNYTTGSITNIATPPGSGVYWHVTGSSQYLDFNQSNILNWNTVKADINGLPIGNSLVINHTDPYGNVLTPAYTFTKTQASSIQLDYYGNEYINLIGTLTFVDMYGTTQSVQTTIPIFNLSTTIDTSSVSTVFAVDNGVVTVNGAVLNAGAPYNQSLNTTNDVVFNSALIGDVSIIGNTIAGLDSYGNSSAVYVDGDLNVVHTSTTTDTAIPTGSFYYNFDLYTPTNRYLRLQGARVSNWASVKTKLATLAANAVIEFPFTDPYGNIINNYRLIVAAGGLGVQTDYYGAEYIDIPGSLEYWDTGSAAWLTVMNNQWFDSTGLTFNSTVSSTTMSVTSAGLAVTGTLTVNGTAVGSVSAVGAVGSYAMLTIGGNNGNINPGSTVTSSGMTGPLFFAGQHIDSTGAGDTYTYPMGADGTWMCMGYAPTATYDMSVTTLWYRVS